MAQKPTTVVVLGATGHFGGRICRRMVWEPGIRLVVTARRLDRAERLAGALSHLSRATVQGVALDYHGATFEHDLAALQPTLVIHTAGPFQGQDYGVAEACVACDSHYLDLADGRDFVTGFGPSLDASARRADLLLVAGASTLPGLSSAVVAEIAGSWHRVDEIRISIAPAQQTPRGASTIAAVLSYCGKPFEMLRNGRWQMNYGWQNLELLRYAKLGRRLSAVCDVPDLALFPARYTQLKTMEFRASLESRFEHTTLWLCAALTRIGLVRDWSRFARVFESISRVTQKVGSDVGGMRIDILGLGSDGEPRHSCWDLVARNNHGPEIPVTPALVLAKKLIRNELKVRGALPCFELMSLPEFADEVTGLEIGWDTIHELASQ